MKPRLFLVVAILVSLTAVYLSEFNRVSAQQPAPNTATIDVTINDQGQVSVGGINLAALGVQPLDAQTVALVSSFNGAHVVVQGQELAIDLQGTPVGKLIWNPTTRQNALNLANRLGVQLPANVQERIEEWISTTTIDLTARKTNEPSKPAVINLAKPVKVDIAQDGAVAVESIPVTVIDAATLEMLRRFGSQALLCWDKGTLHPKIDGQDLPDIQLSPEGLQLISQALNLGITNMKEPLLASKFGFDVAFPGGTHPNGAGCTQ